MNLDGKVEVMGYHSPELYIVRDLSSNIHVNVVCL